MTKKRGRPVSRIYWPHCAICQYMRKHQDFRLACMNSSYLNIHGAESLKQVMKRYQYNVPMYSMYAHMKRHQFKDIARKQAQQVIEHSVDKQVENKLQKVVKGGPMFIDGIPIDVVGVDGAKHELGLDEFIALGRAKLNRGEMTINASTYLQAIKIRADIDKTTKDRKVDVLKMFTGASPGAANGQSEGA